MAEQERAPVPCLHQATLRFDTQEALELSSYEHLGTDCLECTWRGLEGALPHGWRLGVERIGTGRYRVVAGTAGSTLSAEGSSPAGAIARLRAALPELDR
jgi:hypothetical protein